MSTILKSLKKLEQEKEEARYAVHAGPGTVAVSGGSSRWTKVTWIRRSIAVVLILGLGATSIYFYMQNQNRPPVASPPPKASQPPVHKVAKGTIQQKVSQNQSTADPGSAAMQKEAPPQNIQHRANRQPVVPAPEPNAIIRHSETARPVAPAPEPNAVDRQRETARPVVPTPDPNTIIRQREAARPVVPAPEPNTVKRQRESAQPVIVPHGRPTETAQATPTRKPALTPAEQPSPPPKLPTRRQPVKPIPRRKPIPDPAVRPENQPSTAKVQKSGSRTPQKPTQQPSDAYDSVRPLTDGRLKIHAIVWSDTPEDRMAVINTQILHEGDTVSGFAVVAIRPDDVVVRGEGGNIYRVIFGRP